MIRFEDFYIKLHIGSKCLTGGGVSILLGIILLKGWSLYSLKLGLIIIFLITTNPITTHAIARAGYYDQGNENETSDQLVRDDLKEKKVGELQ
ncbi:hypothetical protein JCM16358_21750 [Halanaerocella petrolearia]